MRLQFATTVKIDLADGSTSTVRATFLEIKHIFKKLKGTKYSVIKMGL